MEKELPKIKQIKIFLQHVKRKQKNLKESVFMTAFSVGTSVVVITLTVEEIDHASNTCKESVCWVDIW